MGFVRVRAPPRMDAAWAPLKSSFSQVDCLVARLTTVLPGLPQSEEGPCQDLLYIGLTIVAFAVLWLLVKGVERFER